MREGLRRQLSWPLYALAWLAFWPLYVILMLAKLLVLMIYFAVAGPLILIAAILGMDAVSEWLGEFALRLDLEERLGDVPYAPWEWVTRFRGNEHYERR